MINSRVTLAILTFLVSFFVILEAQHVHRHVLGADAGESISIMFNVAKHNFFALNDVDNKNAIYATNQREPLPIFLWAQSLKTFSDVDTIENVEKLLKLKALKKAKYINVIFLLILMVSLILLIFQIPNALAGTLTKVVLSGLLIITLKLYGFWGQINFFVNDLHTAAILSVLLLQIVSYFNSPSKVKLLLIGIIYGLLCLTKATYFYSGIVVFILVIIYQLFYKLPVKQTVLVLIAALMITAPWLARNYIQTGQIAISGRGPETFVDRTYEEIYNDKHFIGLWYAYSPDFLKPLATKLTGYGFKDRDVGGRLQHSTRPHRVDIEARKLNDESMAINCHFKATIWMKHIYDNIYAQVKNPVIAKKQAQKIYQQFALKEMFDHPVRHIKFSTIFAWRGIWILNAIDGRTFYEVGLAKQQHVLKQILPLMGFVSLTGLFLYGVVARQYLITTTTIFLVAAYFFNSFFSHNIPRYGNSFLPFWLLAFGFVMLVAKHKLNFMIVEFNKNH